MRRVGFVLMMVVALVVGGGVALAAAKFGTDGQDFLVSTKGDEVHYGKGGIDFIDGRGGNRKDRARGRRPVSVLWEPRACSFLGRGLVERRKP